MSKRKIIFRADGNPIIGMGHFIRSLALAKMLKNDFNCIFATQKPTEYQIAEISRVCENRLDLPTDNSHFDLFLDCLMGDEIIVLDNYYFTTNYQKKIKAKGVKLVCIDDMHDKHFVADIVINHAEGIKPSDYTTEKYTKVLLGYKYALLRKEYLFKNELNHQKKYSCFLMMGGTDPFNITLKLISLLKDYSFSLPIAVVVGTGYSYEKQLEKFKNIILFKGIAALQVFQLMQYSEFGILPASTVAIEASAARLPFICGNFVDNQNEFYSGIKKSKLAICVDSFLTIEKDKLHSAIYEISNKDTANKIKYKQAELLDRKSNNRFIKIFKEL